MHFFGWLLKILAISCCQKRRKYDLFMVKVLGCEMTEKDAGYHKGLIEAVIHNDVMVDKLIIKDVQVSYSLIGWAHIFLNRSTVWLAFFIPRLFYILWLFWKTWKLREIQLFLYQYRTRAIRPRSIYSIFHFFASGLFKKVVYSRRRSV